MSKNPIHEELTRLHRLRNALLLEQEIQQIKSSLQQYPNHIDFHIEGLHLLILTEQLYEAFQIYLQIRKLPTIKLSPELLLRLHLLTGQPIPELDGPINEVGRSSWLLSFAQTGTDPFFKPNITRCTMFPSVSWMEFTFDAICPSCSCSFSFPVSMSLAIYREFYCPECFCRQHIEFEDLRPALLDRFTNIDSPDIRTLDTRLKQHLLDIHFDTLTAATTPRSVRHLYLDYSYLLTGLLHQKLEET